MFMRMMSSIPVAQQAVREEVNVIVHQERFTTHYKRDGGIWEFPVALKNGFRQGEVWRKNFWQALRMHQNVYALCLLTETPCTARTP